jgi:hypothetical protein
MGIYKNGIVKIRGNTKKYGTEINEISYILLTKISNIIRSQFIIQGNSFIEIGAGTGLIKRGYS